MDNHNLKTTSTYPSGRPPPLDPTLDTTSNPPSPPSPPGAPQHQPPAAQPRAPASPRGSRHPRHLPGLAATLTRLDATSTAPLTCCSSPESPARFVEDTTTAHPSSEEAEGAPCRVLLGCECGDQPMRKSCGSIRRLVVASIRARVSGRMSASYPSKSTGPVMTIGPTSIRSNHAGA